MELLAQASSRCRVATTVLALMLLRPGLQVAAQDTDDELNGRVITYTGYFEALENVGGEAPDRQISIYLPEEYGQSESRYPVIYFLPGFASTGDEIMGSLAPLVDAAISSGDIDPVIVVVPDHYTTYRGSYFADSAVNGNWRRFTAEDVVTLLDESYRTIPDRRSRAIAGWSSGAYGAVVIGMTHPDVFASVYSMSPGLLAMTDEFGQDGDGFEEVVSFDNREQLVSDPDGLLPNLVVAMGRAFSPNPDNPPFQTDLPFDYASGSLIINETALEKWRRNTPIHMLDRYEDNMRSLEAFKLEWGRNDQFKNVITGAKLFSGRLEELGIEHQAEEYLGTHFNTIFTPDGRVRTEMLPFLDRVLVREDRQAVKR